jgi:hypothetical protein
MSFLRDFILHNSGNEIPIRFVQWAAYGALSAVAGRRVFIDMSHFHVTPNIYVLLIAKAGGRKTSAMDKAFNLVFEADPGNIFSGDNDTYQGILTAMERDTAKIVYTGTDGAQCYYRPYCIFAPEFPDYLQNNPLGMVAFLTNIYDRRHYVYRLKQEDRTLEFPYVMMLACATPEWLSDQVTAKQFQAGYGRRTIMVCNDGYTRRKPSLSVEAQDAWKRCVQRLQAVRSIVGPMIIEPEADKWFWNWYLHPGKPPDDDFMLAWRESWHINLLKVSMLISLSERDDRVITQSYMELALEHLKDVETNMPMVTSRVGRSELVGPSMKIIEVIKNAGGFMHEGLLKIKTLQQFRDVTEQWKTIEWLKATGQLTKVPFENKTYLALPGAVVTTKKQDPL